MNYELSWVELSPVPLSLPVQGWAPLGCTPDSQSIQAWAGRSQKRLKGGKEPPTCVAPCRSQVPVPTATASQA